MKIKGTLLALLFISLKTLFGQQQEDLKAKFDEAERRIVRLPPAGFPQIPSNIVRDLQRRGCTVPQETFSNKPNNFVRGEFVKPGQTDWAVLCSVKGVSTILVYWNGSETRAAAIAALEDRNFIQGITPGKVGFSRGIAPVGKDFIMRHYDAYGGPRPPPIDHQGIEDAFIEKASVTWYFDGGKWLKLTGAD